MASVKTLRIVDPRIEPQPEPTYAVTIGPKQNQYYKIPASGLSNSYITFNNLTTLGADRAYLDTFELELTAEVTVNFSNIATSQATGKPGHENFIVDSFPFNRCCDEARININGGAFFSQPMTYLRAKERYWDQRKIQDAYGNVCPCNKCWLANELAVTNTDNSNTQDYAFLPSRLGTGSRGNAAFQNGPNGCSNNDIIDPHEFPYVTVPAASGDTPGTATATFTMTWREPVFASPFSSRMDETYGRPLYNITSMDLAFNMQDLSNMFRWGRVACIGSVSVNFTKAQLCYQVLTVPPNFTPPPATVVPYRRFVPYITNYPSNPVARPTNQWTPQEIELTSGVYTMNEIPTAIWLFVGPTKSLIQNNPTDGWPSSNTTPVHLYNKCFCPIRNISLTCANTTQILNTAEPIDLYRIAKANGCQDSFTSWGRDSFFIVNSAQNLDSGVGSVLRLIPGTDIVIPEQDLIPGATANNIVFTATVRANVPDSIPLNYREVALWILFEYVGVATITPGQCKITMNPLGDGSVMATAPVVSAASTMEPSTVEGSGFFDKIKALWNKVFPIANKLAKDTGIISKGLSFVPGVGGVLSGVAKSLGYGYKGKKRARSLDDIDTDDVSGGAVMGMGDFC